MADIAYLLSSVGHHDEEIERRERVANELVPDGDTVQLVTPSDAPLSVESTVEEQWAATELVRSVEAHEDEFDAFFVGCFGEPGLSAVREMTRKPVVGSATATFHTAAQVADRFSVLTILDSTEPMVHRQIHEAHLDDRLASVRVVEAPVLDIDHSSDSLVQDMITTGRDAVTEDGAEALIPGCMSLSFMQVHDGIAAELGVPFLDPVRIGLGTASMWAHWNVTQSPVTYPTPDRSKLGDLFYS
ncbi:allantoin racemase [Halogranum rubrum]|uniref:Allantoin racemase n=1 Tax=Halogranum rubrum TaxID=553466 RepID=A0A1I4GSI3_9EURY|nr:aspartate/glutamate racemase family protein [Halogranum rubrum]SFL33008.1 allantoin racemase [Halogranum rubrum]